MEILLLSVVQLAFGLIVVTSAFLVYAIARDYIHRVLWRRRTYILPTHLQPFNEARVVSAGSWQYNDAYFDKIEEFRNDFA